MPATKSARRSTTLNIRSPVQHWLAHLKLSTLSESHNLLQHSSMMKNRAKYSIIHITRNLLRVLIVGNKNYSKLATRLNAMILLSNGSDVYSHLLRMQKIVHESQEYFVEYMRHYIPQHVQSKLENMALSLERAITEVNDFSDYVDTQNRRIFSNVASQSLKTHYGVMESVKNLFIIMVTETYKVILSFMENCASELLNQTIMREIMRHLSTISHAEFVSKCLRMANAIPLFLRHSLDTFYQALLQLCRIDLDSCLLLSSHMEVLCRTADEAKQEEVRFCALEIISLIVSRAAKTLNGQKSVQKTIPNGKNGDIHFDSSLYQKISLITSIAIKQLYRVSSVNSTHVYHSTLRTICGIWRIRARRAKGESDIDVLLSRCVEPLITKLDAFEDTDPKSRQLTMMVIAMLARNETSQKKFGKRFVIQRLLEILEDTHQKFVKSTNSPDSHGSGYIADSESARSTSCESLVKLNSLSLKGKKQVTFASDCTLASARSRLYDMPPSLTKSKGSLPNLTSPSLSTKPVLSNGIHTKRTFKSVITDTDSQFHRQILHNCATALVRICMNNNSNSFRDSGGTDIVNRIIQCEKLDQTILPHLILLRDIETGKEEVNSQDGSVMNGDLSGSGSLSADAAS